MQKAFAVFTSTQFDLISIGDGTCVDEGASLLGYAVEGSELVIGPIQVGRGCFVGTWSILREDTVMEDGARLEFLDAVRRANGVAILAYSIDNVHEAALIIFVPSATGSIAPA